MGRYKGVNPSSTKASTRSSHLVLVNHSGRALRFVWVNFRGEPVQYARVEPGQSKVQNTYSTHSWVAEDDDGNVFAAYNGVP